MLTLSDAEVAIFQLLASKMQLVKSQFFFIYTSFASKKVNI